MPLAVGDGIDVPGEAWSFAGPVADHFDAHVARSVPQYAAGHHIITALSPHFLSPGGTLYDVGCSTGALLAALDTTHRCRDVQLVGVDAEPDMVRAARRRFTDRADVTIVQADVRTLEWRPADVIVAHYCVQFVPVADRPALLAAMYAALRPGGALLWFEKTLAPTPWLQDVLGQAYVDHKLSSGYGPGEVLAKARSLRGVLVPLTSADNRRMLRRAGFRQVATVHQHLTFEGVLAVKDPA
ncbi:methyltransferase domain-containing protein [Streptomyces sp. NPDC006658]|uniref:methyltransferase domain-containing protein n=1 Tax=Streptomyces sp. NPDC006658 TaxID=3156900 RepID=UPI0033FDF849